MTIQARWFGTQILSRGKVVQLPMTLTTYETERDNPLRRAFHAVLAAAPDYSRTATPAMRQRDAALADMATYLDEVLPELSQGLGLAALRLRARRGGHQASYSPTA